MMEDKNIDRLFQEGLKDLEVTPNDSVWNGIESKLKKKKKNRLLPIWWFSGGVAAILVLGLLLYPYIDKQENLEKINPVIVESESSTPEENKKEELKDILLTEPIKENLEETRIVKEETKKKKVLKEKLHTNEVLVANHVVKISKNELQEKDSNIENGVVEGSLFSKNHVVKEENTGKLENSLPVITENAQEESNKKNDSLKQKIPPKKDFLAFVDEKSAEETKEKSKTKSWSVSPTVAVLNSNSFSESSPIDVSLSNSTKGNTSYSYGVQVAYQLNKKWTLQSGIHLQEMGYSNTNVAVNPVTSSSANVVFSLGESYALNDASQLGFSTNSISLSSGSLDGELNQKYGYVEVPVQIKYNFLEGKKLKTELVVGFSSLFLNKNNVTLNTTNFSTSGEANNLNSINFSGNLGIDLNYQLGKKWSININPMLKTQLNTFKNESNGFQPYFIGVYTGINYQF